MGCNIAAIFASFGNTTVYLVSRTLKKSEKAKDKAYRSVRAESVRDRMLVADYSKLEECINEILQLAEKYKYNGGIDYIDAIIGPFTGRAMAPLVTANFVGLDVHKAIVDNLYENTHDFVHSAFVLPDYVEKLVEKGKLGRKSGEGLYKTFLHDNGTKIHQVYDIENNHYREIIKYIFPFVEQMVKYLKTGDYEKAF